MFDDNIYFLDINSVYNYFLIFQVYILKQFSQLQKRCSASPGDQAAKDRGVTSCLCQVALEMAGDWSLKVQGLS